MTRVSCKTCTPFLQALAAEDIPAEALVQDLPVTLAHLQNPENTISLDVYTAICHQFALLIDDHFERPQFTFSPIFAPQPQWRAILDMIDIAIATVAPDGRIQYANHAQRRFTDDESLPTYIHEYFPKPYHDRLKRSLESVITDKQPAITEILITQAASDHSEWVESRMYPLAGESPSGAIVYNINITERKRFEQELQRRAVHLQIVAEVGAQINTVLEVAELIQNVCDLTCDIFDLYHTHIFLLDDSKSRLVVSGGSGEVGKQLGASLQTFRLEPGERGIIASVRGGNSASSLPTTSSRMKTSSTMNSCPIPAPRWPCP